MARDTKGAFDGVGGHSHDIDYRRAREIADAFKAEQRRKHLEGIARRKAERAEARKRAKEEAWKNRE